MISNYNLTCDYHNFELKDKIYLIPDYALKVIYTDGFNEVVFSGNSANVTILEGFDISFQEETSFDERFKFSKTLSIKVNGYKTFSDLDNRYMAIIETKEGEFYLVNVDFPSFVTHTYTLNNGTNSTELVFSSQSNIAALKLTNFEPTNVNLCKEYNIPKIKNVKLTEAWASYLSTWQKSLVNKGEFVDIEPLPDSVSLTEEFDGEKYTVTLGFDIPMSYYKNDWHIKLLQFTENKYRGYISLEDGNKAFVGYNVGLFPSYTINGDIISIRLTETAIRGIAYGDDYAVIDTNMPNSIEFSGATCKNYNFESSCDWNVENKPNYITITPMSGNADTQYELTICNTDDETGYEVSEFIIKSCNANARATVVINNPIYRWVDTNETMCVIEPIERTVSGDPYCNNCDKYIDVFDEISYDGGETWQVTSSSSTLIEADSADCGYRERTITDTYCNGYNKYEDAFNQVSCDSGSTWETVSSSSTMIEECSPECGCFKIIMYGINDDDSISGAVRCSSSNTLTHFEVNDIAGDNTLVPLSGYQHVIIGNCCTKIGDWAFCEAYDTQISRRTIEDFENFDRITEISEYGMAQLRGLKSIDISNVTSLGFGAFSCCFSLSSVTIPSAISLISADAFEKCSGLTSVTIEDGVETIGGGAFEYCTGLSSITIPTSVTAIGDSAFAYCSGLTGVTIPSSITEVNSYAFYGCSGLTSAYLPSSVSKIHYDAFTNCPNMESITIDRMGPPTLVCKYSYQSGQSCGWWSAPIIYVPAAAVETYKNATGYWAAYHDNIRPIPT